MVALNKILTRGKAFYLAYDQGLEHGPEDFNDDNADPLFIIKIAKEGKYNGLIFQKGIAEKYTAEIKKSKVPLIVKLNGKTKLYKGEAVSRELCTVSEAVKLRAAAVGYTIYIGSEYESVMMKEFEEIERDAHKRGLPVIAWVYPRGKGVKDPASRKMMAYAARFGLEIGADIVKMHWNSKPEDLKWALKAAGRCKIVIAGGAKEDEREFLQGVRNIIKCGATGIAVGRNVWQSKKPLEISAKIRKIIFG